MVQHLVSYFDRNIQFNHTEYLSRNIFDILINMNLNRTNHLYLSESFSDVNSCYENFYNFNQYNRKGPMRTNSMSDMSFVGMPNTGMCYLLVCFRHQQLRADIYINTYSQLSTPNAPTTTKKTILTSKCAQRLTLEFNVEQLYANLSKPTIRTTIPPEFNDQHGTGGTHAAATAGTGMARCNG